MLYLYDTTCHDILVTSRFRVVFGLFFLAIEPCYGHEVPGESEFPEDMSDEDAMSNLDSNFTKPKSLGKKNAFDDVDEHRIGDQNYRKSSKWQGEIGWDPVQTYQGLAI